MKTLNKIKMKKVIITLLIAIVPLVTFAQSVFDKFEDMDDVSTVIVNKRAFQLLTQIDVSSDDKEAQEYIDLVESLNSLKVFATENASIATEMKAKVNGYLKSANLAELMRVKDKDGNVKIYIKEGKDKDHVSELFMFVDGISQHVNGERKPEAVIVSITGDIDLNKISRLTKEMDIPGGEHLEKAEKKH